MLGLIYKDILVNKKEILIYFLIIILTSVFFFIPFKKETVNDIYIMVTVLKYIFLMCIMIGFGEIQNVILAGDETKGYRQFIMSSSYGAKGHVRSKYTECIIIGIIEMLWCFFISFVSNKITHTKTDLSIGIIVLFSIQIILRALEYPFMFRYGYKYGRYYKTGIMIAFILAATAYGLYGDISHFISIDAIYEWLVKLSMANISTIYTVIICVIPVASLLIFMLTYFISYRGYRKQEIE